MITRGVLLLLLLPSIGLSQGIPIEDLQAFTGFTINRFDAQMGKRSFKRDYDSPKETPNIYNYYYRPRKSNADKHQRNLYYEENAEMLAVNYQTSSEREAASLKQQIVDKGFRSLNASSSLFTPAFYQQNEFTVHTSVEMKDSVTFYSFYVQKKKLPDARSVVYAEDLLQMSSHEYLLTVFGPEQLKKDEFAGNKCTIIFPNTSHEAIFVWEDEKNLKDIAFILIGTVQMDIAQKPAFIDNPWKTKQGIYIGMPLHELQMINGGPLSFYGWKSDQAGMLTAGNVGNIDFARLNLEFNCLDCDHSQFASASVINSLNAIADRRKIYVATLILHPDRSKTPLVAR